MMSYNPHIHHHKSIRLKEHSFTRAGLYLNRISCQDICRFGNVANDELVMNEYEMVAFNEWLRLSGRFSYYEMDKFPIISNHINGIIWLTNVRATLAVTQNNDAARNDHAAPNNDKKKAGVPEPEIIEKNGGLEVILYNGHIVDTSERFRNDTGKNPERVRRKFGKEVYETINVIYKNPDNIAVKIAEIIKKSPRMVDKYIAQLRKAGLLKRHGPKLGGCMGRKDFLTIWALPMPEILITVNNNTI